MVALVERVASSVEQVGRALERTLFGDVGPTEVAAAIEQAAQGPVVGSHFYVTSVGCVAGLRLDDGSDVVVKVHQPRWSAPFLRRASAVQAACSDAGLPAPRPLYGPLPCGTGLATVESYLEDPGVTEPTPDLMEVSAAGLAAVIDVCRDLYQSWDLDVPEPLAWRPGQLYPGPHSPVFDFDATGMGAEWIDDLARRSRAVVEGIELRRFATHTDWAARNVRFGPDGLRAIYDWDSVSATTEAAAVGMAAQTWRSLGEWDEKVAPGADEVLAYIDAYGEARGQAFSRDEQRAAAAMALWVLAYSARCEHSLDPNGDGGRCRGRLISDGDLLLRRG